MTFMVNGHDLGQLIETGIWVGSVLAAAIIAGIVYLMVRPSRQARQQPPAGLARDEAEEMWRIVDLMDARLAVIERALANRAEEEPRVLAPADDGRDSGRKE
jgi:hypothetical protein